MICVLKHGNQIGLQYTFSTFQMKPYRLHVTNYFELTDKSLLGPDSSLIP